MGFDYNSGWTISQFTNLKKAVIIQPAMGMVPRIQFSSFQWRKTTSSVTAESCHLVLILEDSPFGHHWCGDDSICYDLWHNSTPVIGYPLVNIHSLRHFSNGPVEIVDLPINSMVDLSWSFHINHHFPLVFPWVFPWFSHRFLYVCQMVNPCWQQFFPRGALASERTPGKKSVSNKRVDSCSGCWYILLKNMSSSVGIMILPNIWNNKKCSKPPTRCWFPSKVIQNHPNSLK